MKQESIYTRAVHADRSNDESALSVPIYNATVFKLPDCEEGAEIHNFQKPGYFYGRLGNPTQNALERAIADLEFAESALAFGSGMAAISAILFSFVATGDHIVAPNSVYSTTYNLLANLTTNFGIEVTFIDASDAENFARAIKPNTKLFWIETPSNPLLRITDLTRVAEIAKSHKILTVADNTFASPFNQNPINFEIDIVVHSATKYLGGHSDLSAGAIAGKEDSIKRVFDRGVKLLGGAISPYTSWLVLRGIKTLAVRMRQHNENAFALANMLDSDDRIEAVFYPGLCQHTLHEVAARQMRGFGGMVSLDLGSATKAKSFCESLKLITIATSLGGVESLIQHSASMTHASLTPEERISAGVTDGLLRMSVGIEDPEDLKFDIKQAMDQI